MRLRVDVEVQRVAFLAPGAAGGEFGAVGHQDLDGVVVRMQVCFHRRSSWVRHAPWGGEMSRLYSPGLQGKQAHSRAVACGLPLAICRGIVARPWLWCRVPGGRLR